MASRMLQNFDPSDKEAGLKLLEALTNNAAHIQQQVLGEILARNANTEYLKGFLDGNADKELFKKKVPVVDYEHVKPYIDRIANGEPSEIISTQPITSFIISSGTSGGKAKMLPSTAEDAGRRGMFQFINANVLNKCVEGLDKGRMMYFIFAKSDINTPSGLVVTNATSSYLKNVKSTKDFNPFDGFSCPVEAILCLDTKQSMYCQLLCSLIRRHEVVRVGSNFASIFLRVIKFLEEHWLELCSNIRTGHISDWITEPNCRQAVSLVLNKEMPDLADSIEQECKTIWEGIIKRLWPRTKVVDAICTGTMEQYVPLIDFYSGGLPLVSQVYGSSEGYFGINLEPLSKPKDVSYTLMPNMAYYEFIPIEQTQKEERQGNHKNGIEEDDKIESGIADLPNVKIGQSYELVVTTYTGLYRFKVGDILMVTGFYNNAPKFRFVERKNVILSVDIEKTTEGDLLRSITNAMEFIEPHGFFLSDYTSYVDTSSIPGHYVLFWELQTRGNAEELELDYLKMEECCAVVEQSLDSVYRMLRNRSNVIDPLEIRVVKHGTFEALMQFNISLGSSFAQYKTPKRVKLGKAIEILNSGVLGKFSSKRLPQYCTTKCI